MSKKSGHQEHPAKIRVRTEEGYKQTEIGVIPEDWLIKRMGNIGIFSKGKGIKKDEVLSSGIPCIRYGELYTHYENVITNFNSFISEETAKESKKIKNGDILFAGSGETKEEIGKSACVLYSDDVYAGGDVIILTPKNVDSVFLGYLLNSKPVTNQKSKNGQGDAVVHIYPRGLKSIEISLPPTLEEQKAIATVLTDTDKLINTLKTLIAKKKAIKQGAMQELLTGKTRLEGFSGEWETRKLGDFLTYEQPTKYIVFNTDYNDNYEIPVLTAGKSFILGFTNEKTGIFEDLPVIIFDDFTTASKYVEFPFKVKSSAMKILKKKNHNGNLRFLYEMINQIDYPLGDHKRHWIGEFQYIGIQIPEIEEQNAIARILGDMEREIETLETQLQKTQNLKQGMMQELLTGKTRLVSPEDDKPFNTLAKVAAPNETYSKTTH